VHDQYQLAYRDPALVLAHVVSLVGAGVGASTVVPPQL
jgi:hypothetical protein